MRSSRLVSLLVLFLIAIPWKSEKTQCTSPDPPVDSPAPAEEEWTEKMVSGLKQAEYHIRYQGASGTFVSPNRAKNLRMQYHPLGFEMRPRLAAAEKWAASFQLKGIFREDQLAYTADNNPVRTLKEGYLRYSYAAPFEVEYLNNEKGMRQNFLVNEKPHGTGDLKVKLEIHTDLQPVLKSDTDLELIQPGKEAVAEYRELKVWDADGILLPVRMELEKAGENALLALVVNDAGARYPITVDPLATGIFDTQLEPDQANAQFGVSVSSAGDVNGDGYSDIIVGANAFDNGTADEGAAFIYHGSPGGVSTTPAAMVESNQSGSNFGFSVSSAGDVNGDEYADVIVGAATWSNGELNEGAFWVYYGSSTGINTSSPTMVESNQSQVNLGFSVSGAGDVDNDGFSDVVVGVPNWDGGQSDEGGFFVYKGSATGLDISSPQFIESNQTDAQLGESVSAAGDVNGDGYTELIVGAWLYDKGQTDEGAAFIYHGSATGLVVPAADTLEGEQMDGWFGAAVTNAGDVNGDGYADVGVGMPAYSNGEFQEGAVWVFPGSATGVQSVPLLAYEPNVANIRLGESVATCGDVNGDGYADFMAGSRRYSNPSPSEGATLIFHGSASGLPVVPDQTLESNQNSAEMGISIACAGDVNGDGLSDLVIGCFLYDGPEVNEGVAWIYHGGTSGLGSLPSVLEANQTDARMGYCVAHAGDVNGDGFDDLIVGAYLWDDGEANEGGFFVYYGSPTGFSATPDAILQMNQAAARMGTGVAGAGDVNGDGYADVIVGAPNFTTGGPVGEGTIFVYHGSPSGISLTPDFQFESNVGGAQLGNSVAGIGDINGDGYSDVAAGAWFYESSPAQDNEGKVYVFHGSPSGLSPTPAFEFEGNQLGAFCGNSVAGAGDVNGDGYSDMLVAAYRHDVVTTDEGRVYIFHGSPLGFTVPAGMRESTQAGSFYGSQVASAGDVNGDGFSDVLIGADVYDNGQSNEGIVQVFYGSTTGISATPSVQLEENQAAARFGHSVSSAGDVNGDGYSDVIIGAYAYDNGQTNEGVTYLYKGGPAGLSATSDLLLESDQASSEFGWHVSQGGDINGDGFGEIIVGARSWNGGNANEGAVFVFCGNSNLSRSAPTRQYRSDLVTPLCQNSYHFGSPDEFGMGQFAFSHTGRTEGKLVWEKVRNGQAFSGSPLNTSTTMSGESAAWTDLGTSGQELKEVTSVLPLRTRWRVRIHYHPAKQLDGQVYSRWYYGTQMGAEDIGLLPVELADFQARLIEPEAVELTWQVASETGISAYVIERSGEGTHFEQIGTEPARGGGQQFASYRSVDEQPLMGVSYYRLRMETGDGQTVFSEVETIIRESTSRLSVYPNPTSEHLFVEAGDLEGPVRVSISDLKGQCVHRSAGNAGHGLHTIEVAEFPSGIYLVTVSGGNTQFTEKIIIR